MPLTLVQRRTNQSAASVASLAGTFSPAPTAGNLLVCNANADSTLTMSSTGWTLANSSVNDTGLYQWWKIAGASESATVTIAPGGGSFSCELVIEEWSGNLAASPLDKVAAGPAGVTGNVVASGTTAALAQADELAIAAFGWNDAGGVATANSYTNSYAEVAEVKGAGSLATNVAVAELAVSATGAQTTSVTLSASFISNKSGLIGTYKAAAAAAVVAAPNPLLWMLLRGGLQRAQALLLIHPPVVPAGPVVTALSDTDSGTGSETSDVQATVPGADTSTGTDAGTVSATASDSDSGTESDAGTVAASVPGSDSGTGTDTGVSSTTGTGSDTGTGSEAGTASVTLSGSDSGTGTDAQVSIVSPVAGSDSAAGSETGSVSATVPGSDTSTGTDASTASVTAASSDSGTGTEAQVVTETGAGGEGGAGTEAGTVSVTAPGSDSSTGTETASASVTASGTDSGTGTDAGAVADITGGATPISGSDSGVGTDDGTVVDLTPPAPPDTGGGRDVDFGDETSIYGEPPRHLTDSDFAVSIEHGEVVDLTPPPAPRRIRIKLPRRRAPQPEPVFRALTDGDGAVGTEEQAHFATMAAVDAGRGVEDAGDMQDFSEGAAEEMQVLALLGVL